MKRKAFRIVCMTKYRLRLIHRRLGRAVEISHLTYFGVLFAESKYMYAKVGLVCMCLTVIYMISDTEGKDK